jgi:heme exporter protein D
MAGQDRELVALGDPLIVGGVGLAFASASGWVAAVLIVVAVVFAVTRCLFAWQRRRLLRELREAVAREGAMSDG